MASPGSETQNAGGFDQARGGGMTIVEGYPAWLTRSDWSATAGRSLPGLVFTRGLKSAM